MNQKPISWPAADDLRRDGAFACLDFINSEWTDWRGEGAPTDRLPSPAWWRMFSRKWGLGGAGFAPPTRARLIELRKIRKIMRTAVENGRSPTSGQISWLNRRLTRSPQRWTISSEKAGFGIRIVPTSRGWRAITTALILSFGQLLNDPDRSRLKKCANPDCSYLFYDESTNRSRRWCFANVCGNMIHVRAFRARLGNE